MSKEGSKFKRGSEMFHARRHLLGRIVGRMQTPVTRDYSSVDISRRTSAGRRFDDLQSEAAFIESAKAVGAIQVADLVMPA